VAISESHFSKADSEAGKTASIAYYGLSDEKYCQVLGAVDPKHVSVVNAHIWPRHATTDLRRNLPRRLSRNKDNKSTATEDSSGSATHGTLP
jgi:hypothetical protein